MLYNDSSLDDTDCVRQADEGRGGHSAAAVTSTFLPRRLAPCRLHAATSTTITGRCMVAACMGRWSERRRARSAAAVASAALHCLLSPYKLYADSDSSLRGEAWWLHAAGGGRRGEERASSRLSLLPPFFAACHCKLHEASNVFSRRPWFVRLLEPLSRNRRPSRLMARLVRPSVHPSVSSQRLRWSPSREPAARAAAALHPLLAPSTGILNRAVAVA